MSASRYTDEEIDISGFTANNPHDRQHVYGSPSGDPAGRCGPKHAGRDRKNLARWTSGTTDSTVVTQTVREVFHTVDLHGLRRLGVDTGSCARRSVFLQLAYSVPGTIYSRAL